MIFVFQSGVNGRDCDQCTRRPKILALYSRFASVSAQFARWAWNAWKNLRVLRILN